MSDFIAILQTDPMLLKCTLRRARGEAVLRGGNGGKPRPFGLGYVQNGDVLLRKRPMLAGEPDLERLAGDVESEALVASASGQAAAPFAEDNVEPLRLRRWLFAHAGSLAGVADARAALIAALPDFLQRAVKGDSDGEVVFLAFLARLRALGRLEDADLDPATAASELAATVQELDRRCKEAGAPAGLGPLACVATNGRVLAAASRAVKVSYAVIEGLPECELHGLAADTPESSPQVRTHRRLRALVISSCATGSRLPWRDLPDGHALGVSRSVETHTVPI
jgi:glutamine amidotransferase